MKKRDCTICVVKKGTDQFPGYREADLRLCFRICQIRFSHVVAHFSATIYLYLSDFCSGEFPLLLGAWDGLCLNCYFIGALPCLTT